MDSTLPDPSPSQCALLAIASPFPSELIINNSYSPNPRYDPILDIIVKIPLVQIVAMVMAIFTLAFELPAPFLKGTAFDRNFTFKAVYLLIQGTVAVLFYQVSRLVLSIPQHSPRGSSWRRDAGGINE